MPSHSPHAPTARRQLLEGPHIRAGAPRDRASGCGHAGQGGTGQSSGLGSPVRLLWAEGAILFFHLLRINFHAAVFGKLAHTHYKELKKYGKVSRVWKSLKQPRNSMADAMCPPSGLRSSRTAMGRQAETPYSEEVPGKLFSTESLTFYLLEFNRRKNKRSETELLVNVFSTQDSLL